MRYEFNERVSHEASLLRMRSNDVEQAVDGEGARQLENLQELPDDVFSITVTYPLFNMVRRSEKSKKS